jgi:hypothetical protein
MKDGIATGFAADPYKVRKMKYVIILDNQNIPFIAKINIVIEDVPLYKGGKRRSKIEFVDPLQSEMISKILINKNIQWSSNNVRYLNLSEGELDIINYPPIV